MASFRLRFQGRGGASPPDPGDYPQGVIDNGLEAVYDLKTTAGPTSAYTQTLAVGNVPAGGYSFSAGPPGQLFAPAGETTIDKWWIKDGEIDITGTSVVHCVDSTFTYAGGGKFVSLGGTGEFHGLRCLFDGATQSGTYATAMVVFGAGTTGSLKHCKFVNAPISHFLSFAVQADLEDCFFGMCGHDPLGGDNGTHLELLRNDRGVMNVTRCFIDLRDYKIELPPNPPSQAGWTGIGFHETNSGGAQDIEVNYRDCIFLGCTLQELLYVFQGGAKYLGYNVTMTFNNCVIEPGEGAFVGVAETATGQVIVSGTGNVTDLGIPIINLEGAPP